MLILFIPYYQIPSNELVEQIFHEKENKSTLNIIFFIDVCSKRKENDE